MAALRRSNYRLHGLCRTRDSQFPIVLFGVARGVGRGLIPCDDADVKQDKHNKAKPSQGKQRKASWLARGFFSFSSVSPRFFLLFLLFSICSSSASSAAKVKQKGWRRSLMLLSQSHLNRNVPRGILHYSTTSLYVTATYGTWYSKHVTRTFKTVRKYRKLSHCTPY